MDFREKVRRLVGTQNKSELSRLAGLPDTAIDAVVNKGREPLASNAVKLARVLRVPSDWLFDDERGWPPPGARFDASELSDLEVAQILEARIRRLITVERDPLSFLDSEANRGWWNNASDSDKVEISHVLNQLGWASHLFIGLVRLLADLGEYIVKVNVPLSRAIDTGVKWPGETEIAAMKSMLQNAREVHKVENPPRLQNAAPASKSKKLRKK
jgi:helix-turn-helix protein